jgi:hypothetical protein
MGIMVTGKGCGCVGWVEEWEGVLWFLIYSEAIGKISVP